MATPDRPLLSSLVQRLSICRLSDSRLNRSTLPAFSSVSKTTNLDHRAHRLFTAISPTVVFSLLYGRTEINIRFRPSTKNGSSRSKTQSRIQYGQSPRSPLPVPSMTLRVYGNRMDWLCLLWQGRCPWRSDSFWSLVRVL